MSLLQAHVAQDVIAEGIALGADFVDIFVERTQNEGIVFKNSRAEDIRCRQTFSVRKNRYVEQ